MSAPDRRRRPRKVISGGQTGVDRAALDVALDLGIPIGGWCPRGRRAEDGRIHEKYALRETGRRDYAQRTEYNVRDADGTLIIATGDLAGGTALTRHFAARCRKPCLVVDPTDMESASKVVAWLAAHDIGVLNVAGPREGSQPGVYGRTAAFLRRVFMDD